MESLPKKYSSRLILILVLLFAAIPTFAQKKKKKDKDKDVPDVSDYVIVEADKMKAKMSSEAALVEGMKWFMLEEYEKAIPYFERAQRIDNKNHAALFQLAKCHYLLNRKAEAVPFAEQATEISEKENLHYFELLSDLYLETGDDDKAVTVFEKLIELEPRGENYYYELAQVYIRKRDYKSSIRVYNTAEEKCGINPAVIRRKQMLYAEMGNMEKATEEAAELVRLFPGEEEYGLELADLYLKSRKADKAQEVLEKLLSNGSSSGRATLMLSEIYRLKGEEEKWIETLEKAYAMPSTPIRTITQMLVSMFYNDLQNPKKREQGMRLAKTAVESHPQAAAANSIYADFLMADNKPAESRNYYLRSVSFNPDNYMAWQRVIQLDLELNQIDSALYHSEEATILFPNQAAVWFFRGMALSRGERNSEAVAALEQAKMLAYNDNVLVSDIESQLGDLYNEMKKYEKSDRAYEAALSKNSKNLHALNNYSYFLSLRKEKLDLAAEMSSKLIQIQPDNGTYLDTHGWVLYVKGDYKEAEEHLKKAAEAEGASAAVIEHYGDVLFKLGKKDEALKQWQKAKATGGDVGDKIDKKIADQKLYE